MTESIKGSIDNGSYGCGIFIDLQKAFDTVNHQILLQKLEHYGIRGIANCWFSSYLSARKQNVSVNGHISDHFNISCGVPQGTVLGPPLFLLYINDLPNVSKLLTFYLFADDTNIYLSSSDLIKLQKTMNRDLRKVRKWLAANRLALNIEKTNYVIFHSPNRKISEPISIKIGRKRIRGENTVKFLCVLLDSNLNWKPRITELSKKLARTVGVFFKIRHFVPLDTLKLLYYSLFYAFVSYGIAIWGLTHKTLINTVFLIQKKILKAVTFSDTTVHSDPIFSRLGLLKVGDIFQLQLLSFMYDCYHGLAPSYFSSYLLVCITMILGQPLVVIYFCKERTHLFMVLDQFSTLAQDCGTLCLHQLETHNLFQYLDYKLKPYFFHTTWKTNASTNEFIMPHAWN